MKTYRSQVDFRQYRARRPGHGFLKLFRRGKKAKTADPFNRWDDRPTANPWKQKPKKNWKNIIFLVLTVVFTLAWAGLIFYLPYFQITKITITGTRTTDPQAVENYIREELLYRHKVIPGANYFLLRRRGLEEGTTAKFGLRETVIKKIFPHEIIVDVREKICSVIYFAAGQYYLVDKNGKIITRILSDIQITTSTATINSGESTTTTEFSATATTTDNYDQPDINLVRKNFPDQPIIYDREGHGSGNEMTVINPDIVARVIDWDASFSPLALGEIKYFERENAAAGIKVYLDRGWHILFNPDANLAAQLANLKTILTEITPTEYVDLRFGEKIYWK